MSAMSGVQLLRIVLNERLSLAAEEIFQAVRKTLASYEEELVQSKREIRRLQTLHKPDKNINKNSDQPQLSLSVWDEGSLTNQQQQSEDSECTASLNQNYQEPLQATKSHENYPNSQEGENSIGFIFKNQKNKSDNFHTSLQAAKEVKVGPLPGTSTENDKTKEESENCDSHTSFSEAENDSDEDWEGGSTGSEGEDNAKIFKLKLKMPRLPTDPKHHTTKKKSKSRISCKVCGKAFHATDPLVNHMEIHPKDVCGVCGERFDSDESFESHVKTTHVKAGTCKICGKCFGASSTLQTHMRVHTGEKPFSCSECGKSFNCRHNMVRHIRIHTGEKPYPCTVCGKRFNDYSTLKRHLLIHVHKKNLDPNNMSSKETETEIENDSKKDIQSPKKQQNVCEVCGKVFHSLVSLVNHAKSQHATDICGVCGAHFESEENLKSHLKTHKNGKVCEVCGKCFDSPANLRMHMRIHTGEKPFLCSECGKSFNCRHNMTRHIRTHTGEKPYLCNVCGKGFSDHSTLKHHSSTHTGEKPHRCDICGKGFHRKTYVRLHMKSHTREVTDLLI